MPPVDLDNLVSACAGGCSDSKIACETLADEITDDEAPEDDVTSEENAAAATVDPDFPPESFWLSKDAEYDWFDRNTFYERKDSGRGSSSLNSDVNSTSNSQRFSVHRKSKAAMIGLPKTQKTTYVDPRRRMCKPANARLFPKRPEPVGKSAVPGAEPGSPKVSCMGRVRSKRSRRRSNSSRRREKPQEKSRSGGENQLEKSRSGGEKQKKIGFYSKMIGMFRSKKGRKKPPRSGSRKVAEEAAAAAVAVDLQRWSVSSRVREIPVGGVTVAEPPGLGGMNRFASGRRSGSWTAEDFNQTLSGSDRHAGAVSWS